MPRSQCESENVQFVQELAEVDGPFESPININFRDLKKIELPLLVWNRGETCPKKMKITNTGHTVIISGKWKCERPYLTGGPLTGKYVFSQIHFHWGPDDCGGSEHLVCGDGFPLEMHVAHFRAEYLTQENALREKDGMVVVVYLFKLQDEPNQSLKKIIDLISTLKQASTSHEIDPRPILSICKPFTDDYFMYWGSVVTSTCAHILLWIICREPFGISREQVMEFRKIMDSCQQPICKNSREVQPLHKRNVFHVNPSKQLDQPLLPIKNILACYCKEKGEYAEIQQPQTCTCEQPKEDVEGTTVDCFIGSDWWHDGGTKALDMKMNDCFTKQTIFVQRATISVLLKRFDSEPGGLKNHVKNNDHDTLNIGTKSCCFFTHNPFGDRKVQKRKTPLVKRPFKNARAFSQLMNSFEFLKNQTSKKLKEIESINQEVKGMKMFCSPTEDGRWLGKIEKMMKRQKRFNFNYSDSPRCFGELRKIAKDCNLKFLPEKNILSLGDNNPKAVWVYNDEEVKENLPDSKPVLKASEEVEDTSKFLNLQKDQVVPEKAHNLIQNFFEDIQDSDEEVLKNDTHVQKVVSSCNKTNDSEAVSNTIKGYITENMFLTGNLEDRFFKEVTADEFEIMERITVPQELLQKNTTLKESNEKINKDTTEKSEISEEENENLTEVHALLPSKTSLEINNSSDTMTDDNAIYEEDENIENPLTLKRVKSSDKKKAKPKQNFENSMKIRSHEIEFTDSKNCRAVQTKSDFPAISHSVSNSSTESNDTHQLNNAKFRKRPFMKDSSEQSSFTYEKNFYMPTCEKKSCKEIEAYHIHRKNLKHKKRKKHINELHRPNSSSSKEDLKTILKKLKWKSLRKANLELETEKTNSSSDLEFKSSAVNLQRKKLKLRKQGELTKSPGDNSQEDVEETALLQFFKDGKDPELKLKWNHYRNDSSSNNELMISTVRVIPSSLADSKLNLLKNSKTKESEVLPSPNIKVEIPKRIKKVELTPVLKNRSLGSLLKQIVAPEKNSLRHHIKPLSSRIRNKNEISITNDKFTTKILPSNLTSMSDSKQKQFNTEADTNFKLLTFKQIKDELLPNRQVQNIREQVKTLKRCDMDKYQFLEKNFIQTPTFKDFVDIINQTDSNKSFAKDASKGDAELEKPNFQTSVSFLTLKMSSPSRPHSEETLSSNKQTFKRRSKKRPNCCKRNSKHYMRKNSTVFKKLSKTDNKPFNLVNPTEEGQFHKISLNIQKFFKQKLDNQVKNMDPSKSCSLAILSISSSERLMLTKSLKKIKLTQTEELAASKKKSVQQISIRTVKAKEKTLISTQNLVKTKLDKSHFEPSEPERQASDLPCLLKLNNKTENDQISNCLLQSREENGKLPPENQRKKFKSRIPKKQVDKTEKIGNLEAKPPPPQKRSNHTLRKLPGKEINRTKTTTRTTEKSKIAPPPPNNGNFSKIKTRQTLQETPTTRSTCTAISRGGHFTSFDSATPSTPALENQKGKFRKEQTKKIVPNKKSASPITPTQAKPQLKNFKIQKTGVGKVKKPPSQVPKLSTNLESSQKSVEIPKTKNLYRGKRAENLLEKKISLPFNAVSSSYTLTSINAIESQTQKLDYSITGCEEKLSKKALQQNLSEKKFNFPINLLWPYIPSSIDLSSKQPSSLPDLWYPGYDNYPIEDDFEEGKGPLFSKEFEYFFKLRMLFNSEFSGKKENYYATSLIENSSISDQLCLDSRNNKTVLLESAELKCISSCSKFLEEPGDKLVKSQKSTTKDIEESSDSPVKQDRPEESNSDSSYEYKISITLNTIHPPECTQEKKPYLEVTVPKLDYIFQKSSLPMVKEETLFEQEENITKGKHNKKKRKENEMSTEMKQKLIEIFEEEIYKGITVAGSSENLSDGNKKLEDSDKTFSQSSAMTSHENLEILHQISDTMKEYLMDLKENGQLEKMLNKSLEVEKSK